MRAALLLLALLGGAVGCVTVTWSRTSRFTPVGAEKLAHLEQGKSELAACLAELGAPLWVWEHGPDGSGAALAWGWFDEQDLGFDVSVPLTENTSASFDYTSYDARMHGLVLFFDERWVLTSFRTGLLRDLTREGRRPPVALEEDA